MLHMLHCDMSYAAAPLGCRVTVGDGEIFIWEAWQWCFSLWEGSKKGLVMALSGNWFIWTTKDSRNACWSQVMFTGCSHQNLHTVYYLRGSNFLGTPCFLFFQSHISVGFKCLLKWDWMYELCRLNFISKRWWRLSGWDGSLGSVLSLPKTTARNFSLLSFAGRGGVIRGVVLETLLSSGHDVLEWFRFVANSGMSLNQWYSACLRSEQGWSIRAGCGLPVRRVWNCWGCSLSTVGGSTRRRDCNWGKSSLGGRTRLI